jgi:hypothetical protein
MAISIPSQYKLHISTTVTDDYGTVFDRTDDGKTYARDLYTNPIYEINAVWDQLESNDANTLREFLLVNRLSDFTVVVDNVSYNCKMIGYPNKSWLGGTLTKVTAKFRGTLNA